MKQEDDIKLSIRAMVGSVLIVAILFLFLWSFMLQRQLSQMQDNLEDWSQHIAEKVADAENKANLKYEADIETLETMFGLIYKLKQMEAENEDTE
jgi:predicted PurR-regulated permease PerM